MGRLLAGGFVGQRSAADAVNGPAVDDFLAAQALEQHAVGVERRDDVGAPDDFGRGVGRHRREDGLVGKVAPACGGERTVERHAVRFGAGAAPQKEFGGLFGPHRVTAGGAVADFE